MSTEDWELETSRARARKRERLQRVAGGMNLRDNWPYLLRPLPIAVLWAVTRSWSVGAMFVMICVFELHDVKRRREDAIRQLAKLEGAES